jgi:hypothetical protein
VTRSRGGAGRLAACGAVALFALAALVAWGCAAQGDAGVRPHDARNYAPDGGWQNYKPAPNEYGVDPARAATGLNPSPSLSPLAAP